MPVGIPLPIPALEQRAKVADAVGTIFAPTHPRPFMRWPITVLHADSTGPEPIAQPLAT